MKQIYSRRQRILFAICDTMRFMNKVCMLFSIAGLGWMLKGLADRIELSVLPKNWKWTAPTWTPLNPGGE